MTLPSPVTTNHGPAGAPISVTQPAPDPYKVGPQSVLLDLNGNGIEIAAPDRSSTFLGSGDDGRQHRTGWAGTGDGVLICAAGNDGLIREKREHVFTEWGPTAKDDMAALRSRFDSNNTGRRTSADAEFSKFKVKVTGADGSRLAGALARLAQVLGACPQDPGTWSALGSEFANFGAKDMMRRDTAVAV